SDATDSADARAPGDDGSAGDDDAGRDGAVDLDAHGCAPGAHLFCDDFEKGDLTAWTSSSTPNQPPATIAVTDARAWSVPKSLAATLDPFPQGPNIRDAYIEKQLPGSFDSVWCSMRVYAETLPTEGEPDLVHLAFTPMLGAQDWSDAVVT